MTSKIEQLENQIKQENKKDSKTKIICPECKSENVETEGNFLAQRIIKCKDCGYQGTQLLEVGK